jgi:hypothetical protein
VGNTWMSEDFVEEMFEKEWGSEFGVWILGR